MFIGHYAAALAAKAAAPRAPLWALVGGAHLLDTAFSGFLIAGVERFRVDASQPGNPLVLEHMPWSHSLVAAVAWSLLAAGAGRLLRLRWDIAALIGAVVFSHWLLDWLVHRPDLALWPGGEKVGLGFWNFPAAEMALEVGLLGVAGAAWIARRKEGHQSAWPAMLFLSLLIGLSVMFALPAPPPDSPVLMGVTGIIMFVLIAAIAWPIDRSWRQQDA